jgi:hypothetical protein
MLDDGWISVKRRGSYSSDTGEGQQTRITANKKFSDWFADLDKVVLPKALKGFEDVDPIVLKVTQEIRTGMKNGQYFKTIIKKPLPCPDTKQIRRWRKNVTTINNCLLRHWSDLMLTNEEWPIVNKFMLRSSKSEYEPIMLHQQTVRRVFSSSTFDQGGRFYGGWWQNIPSFCRSRITLDGKETVELDFKTLHPTILYLLEDLEIDDAKDLYDIGMPNVDRDVIKKCFNAMINAPHELTRKPANIALTKGGPTWKEIKEAILVRHEPIKHCFFKLLGNELQFMDSELAEEVMLHFANQDEPVLPVHDSFIVHHGHKQELENVMSVAFKKKFKKEVAIKAEPRDPVRFDLTIPKTKDAEFREMDISIEGLMKAADHTRDWSARN